MNEIWLPLGILIIFVGVAIFAKVWDCISEKKYEKKYKACIELEKRAEMMTEEEDNYYEEFIKPLKKAIDDFEKEKIYLPIETVKMREKDLEVIKIMYCQKKSVYDNMENIIKSILKEANEIRANIDNQK